MDNFVHETRKLKPEQSNEYFCCDYMNYSFTFCASGNNPLFKNLISNLRDHSLEMTVTESI